MGCNAREGCARPEGLHLALLQQETSRDVQNAECWGQSIKTEKDGALHTDISVGGA